MKAREKRGRDNKEKKKRETETNGEKDDCTSRGKVWVGPVCEIFRYRKETIRTMSSLDESRIQLPTYRNVDGSEVKRRLGRPEELYDRVRDLLGILHVQVSVYGPVLQRQFCTSYMFITGRQRREVNMGVIRIRDAPQGEPRRVVFI